MTFALAAYNLAAAAAGGTNLDMAAVVDPTLTQRNGHYTFTAPFKLKAAALIGASVTRGRFQVPSWNAWAQWDILNVQRSLTPPSNPQVDWYGQFAPDIPVNEEFQVQASNNLGAATEQENCILWLDAGGGNVNQPRGGPTFVADATFTATPTINVWSAAQQLAFTQTPRGGVYSVMGAVLQGANAVAFRMIFPRVKLYMGLPIRPGGLVQTAVGDALPNGLDYYPFTFGEWGRFHTFELPQVEVLGTTAAAITYRLFLWLTYLGPDLGLLMSA